MGDRDPACVERWPECEVGAHDPRCCRFPKSCSCEAVSAPEPDRTAARVRDALGAEWHSSYTSDGLTVCVKFGCVGEHEDGCPFAALDALVAERDRLRETLTAIKNQIGLTVYEGTAVSVWSGKNISQIDAALSTVAPPPPQETP